MAVSNNKRVTATLSSATSTSAIPIRGTFSWSVSGISGDTVDLERSFDNGGTWKVVKSITADEEFVGDEFAESVLYRTTVSTYSAGTIVIFLGR